MICFYLLMSSSNVNAKLKILITTWGLFKTELLAYIILIDLFSVLSSLKRNHSQSHLNIKHVHDKDDVSSRKAEVSLQVQNQPGLHTEMPSQKTKQKPHVLLIGNAHFQSIFFQNNHLKWKYTSNITKNCLICRIVVYPLARNSSLELENIVARLLLSSWLFCI